MKRIKLYHIGSQWMTEEMGSYVTNPFPEILNNADIVIECDSIFCPVNDGNMCNLLAVEHNGKIGLLTAEGSPFSSWQYIVEGTLFRYDRVALYSNISMDSDEVYAVLWEGDNWRVVKMDVSDSKSTPVLIEEKGDDDYFTPINYIPFEYRLGFGSSPFSFTPERITRLSENEIFVFGSNKEGFHRGGAARVAVDHFGAQSGVGVGRTGQCYAIPTMDGSLDLIREYVEGFRCYAYCHPELTFFVTRIGCGIAGWEDEQIAPLFSWGAFHSLANVILPREWVRLNSE